MGINQRSYELHLKMFTSRWLWVLAADSNALWIYWNGQLFWYLAMNNGGRYSSSHSSNVAVDIFNTSLAYRTRIVYIDDIYCLVLYK